MAALLVIGAIPSGLAGTVTSAGGLYTIRFFIGILGGTFVPCQAWTTVFFDKAVVGRANALVGGWGNSGGGFTFIIMLATFNRLRADGLSSHSAWRAAFAIVPVPSERPRRAES
jgi:NNP family nitrate/nitrite transporter-like MFS transporter